MTYLKIIWTFLKNWKNIIVIGVILALVALAGVQTYRIQNIKLEAEKDKVKIYEETMVRIDKLTKEKQKNAIDTAKITKKLDELKGKPYNEKDLVAIYSAIIDRHNRM